MATETVIKITVLGSENVGKTKFLQCYAGYTVVGPYRIDTVFDTVTKHKKFKTTTGLVKNVTMHIWDTKGQKMVNFSAEHCCYADGYFVLFDLIQPDSLQTARNLILQLQHHSNSNIVLCGNKSDLRIQRKISVHDANMVAKELKVRYLETSAVTGYNVEVATEILFESAMENYSNRSKYVSLENK